MEARLINALFNRSQLIIKSTWLALTTCTKAESPRSKHLLRFPTVRSKEGKVWGANAMKHVAAGAHLPTPWLFYGNGQKIETTTARTAVSSPSASTRYSFLYSWGDWSAPYERTDRNGVEAYIQIFIWKHFDRNGSKWTQMKQVPLRIRKSWRSSAAVCFHLSRIRRLEMGGGVNTRSVFFVDFLP